jgi:hypothetical protein
LQGAVDARQKLESQQQENTTVKKVWEGQLDAMKLC